MYALYGLDENRDGYAQVRFVPFPAILRIVSAQTSRKRVGMVEERHLAGVALALLLALVVSLAFVVSLVTARDAASKKGRGR